MASERSGSFNFNYGGGRAKSESARFEGLRGFFAWEDETDPAWKAAVMAHGGGVPKFGTKAECEEFVKAQCAPGSNPDFPNLQHIFTMLVTWNQIRDILLPAMAVVDAKYPYVPHRSPVRAENRFVDSAVESGVTWRTELPFHRETNRESTMHTLKYLFFHMRCGIFVMIRAGKVVLFAPFVNKDYENNWAEFLKFDSSDGSFKAYYEEKRNHYRRENIIPDIRKWWANGNIICNEHCKDNRQLDETQYWGDQFLAQLRDMLDDCCKHRDLPDCEFFINKRDYPHLKNNLSEPYGFLFDRDDRNPDEDLPLTQYKFPSYAPIMSFYISNRFADIPFPCSEDWEAATGLVFPPSFQHTHCHHCPCKNKRNCEANWECFCPGDRKYHGISTVRDLFTASNFKKFDLPWEDKVDTAFFRGTATGGGTTIDTNQRLHLAHLSNLWKTESEYHHLMHPLPYLDAEITAWNLRDKKIAKNPMTFVRKERFQGRGEFTAGKHHYIPMYEQSKYKYILYVEGHCAANRYAFLMRLGGVILKVTSKCVADEMWYTPLLQPMVDHVPIKPDLSDLAEKIQWCRDNDDKCREIAARAKWLYDNYVSKEGIHDYMEMITTQIAQKYVHAPTRFGYVRPKEDVQPPSMRPTHPHSCVGGSNNQPGRVCRGCKDGEAEYRVQRQKLDEDDEKYGANKPLQYDNYRQGGGRGRGRGGYSQQNSNSRNSGYQAPRGPPAEKSCRRCRRKISLCMCSRH
ncbi:hypothetical protein SDRG_13290 [Saprolegnia diclina VS20]|uniref:Glycosyl transferase CAP10 domain-containing protein n=1 Tax=Saprolegnia diclina (strain VS20) TaxID=1156394 RepID=T0RA22_SAPDV|nr:hypothetical protein SDRG_13290 [Saprolegnia diclina VS20]EQC28953.1 hypothetical protein SDRG_13290 [Saprolegnia diclina VS20]|eukprot:XP_008617592.1 hypothetical protein SDRG_13290 [Saprolegnia diclina VS20]